MAGLLNTGIFKWVKRKIITVLLRTKQGPTPLTPPPHRYHSYMSSFLQLGPQHGCFHCDLSQYHVLP